MRCVLAMPRDRMRRTSCPCLPPERLVSPANAVTQRRPSPSASGCATRAALRGAGGSSSPGGPVSDLAEMIPLPTADPVTRVPVPPSAHDDGDRGPQLVALNSAAVDRPVRLSVIVPTRNEADNMATLLARLGPAVAAMSAEILVVDDSDDETPRELARDARGWPGPVRPLDPSPAQPQGRP